MHHNNVGIRKLGTQQKIPRQNWLYRNGIILERMMLIKNDEESLQKRN